MNRITVAVHTKSGSRLHIIDRPEPLPVRAKVVTGRCVMLTRATRRLAALIALGLIGIYSITAALSQPVWPNNIPTVQQIHDQLAKMKAQGIECEYDENRARIAIIAALAQQVNADEPLVHHPAWEADMQPASLMRCGLIPGSPAPPAPPVYCGQWRAR